METKKPTAHSAFFQRFGSSLFTLFVVFIVVLPLGTCSFANTLEEEPDHHDLFRLVERYLDKYYWDLGRARPAYLFRRALSSLENAADEIYVDNSDPQKPLVRVHVGKKYQVYNLNRVKSLQNAFYYLNNIFAFLQRNYEGKGSLNDIRYATANGFLTGLDPHTVVFSPKAFKEFYVHIEGEIGGVGMLVGIRKGKLSVIEVLKGTPAKRGGFQRGDIIVQIGEESTINMSVSEAVQRIRGPRGTPVVLTVKRRAPDSDKMAIHKISVVRDRVVIKSVESKLLRGGFGFIMVRNFDKNTLDSLKEHLRKLRTENDGRGLSGLVLDLRNNSGGLLKQAAEMADLFLKSGALYFIAHRNEVTSHEAVDDGNEPEFPIVVLCNENSASGAEIVIGALQKNHRGLVLGTTTFGKGSVQQLHPLKHGAQLKITVSEYLIPGKISIQENGVVPHILAEKVVFTEDVVDLFPGRRRGVEKDYEQHIVSQYARHQQPAERIQYPYAPPKEDPNTPDPFMSGNIKPLEDTLVRIARQLLQLSSGGSEDERSEAGARTRPFRSDVFLKTHKEEIESIHKRQYRDIVRKLKERGIDWSEGKNPEKNPELKLELFHEITQRPPQDEDDPYPEKVLLLKAKLTNPSESTLYRVSGISRADHYLYNEKEFLFGKVEPGQTVERTAEVFLRPLSATRSDVFFVAATCPGLEGPIAQASHEVVLRGEDIPEFSYSLTLLDRKEGKPLTHLSPGTEALLVARIKNIGKRALRQGVVTLKSVPPGREVFLEVGRVEIRDIAPEETKEVKFRFIVRPYSRKEEYKFEFGVFDSYYPAGLSWDFKISADKNSSGDFENGEWLQPPTISLKASTGAKESYGNQELLVTDQDSFQLSTSIRGTQWPIHAWVATTLLSVNEDSSLDKIFFDDSRDITTRVPLKVGQNAIYVVATNDRGLTRRKLLFVRRDPLKTVQE